MQKFFALFLVFFMIFSLSIHEAYAKRFGGGRSFGMSRTMNSYRSTSLKIPPSNYSAAAQNKSKWLGPLAGFAMGGLLASLLMGHGLGSGIFSWLLIAGIIFTLLQVLRMWQRNKMSMAPTNYQAYHYQPDAHHHSGSSASVYPAGFNESEFVREAKTKFFRLQAAYDDRNLNDLRMFTTPEVYGEIQEQLQERGQAANVTEVLKLDAELLDAKTEYQSVNGIELAHMIASLRFSGLIREDNQEPNNFQEVWHFRKDSENSPWLVAGVQQ